MKPEIFSFSPEQTEKLERYLALLNKWQKTINLVSPKTLENAWQRHILDSAQLIPLIDTLHPSGPLKILDMGSGAGFPGLVLASLRSNWNISLIESDTRKCAFLQNVSRETSTPVTIINQRIEQLSPDQNPDIITARALASLTDLCAYTLPYFESNPTLTGFFLKGQQVESEISDCQKQFDFSYDLSPSQTDLEARIIKIGNVQRRT
jgi:16S rRNA (guanine527-N7)-methyltransferase